MMIRRMLFFLMLNMFSGYPEVDAQGVNPVFPLIPLPKSFSGYKENGLSLRRLVIGVNDNRLYALTRVLGEEIPVISGMDICTDTNKAAVNLDIDLDDRLPEGEYTLVIGKTIQVKAGSYRSACWATASLLQLMKSENGRLIFPIVSIKDRPSSDYRGVLLDVARNWTEPATIRSIIRICRFYKIDYLQLHLSDNESFTFPSRAFPALPTPGRHYSMDTLQALIRFADDRGVTLVPELELPGHSGAMRREMPGLFGGKTPDYIDVSRPEVMGAAKTIVKEVSEVFNSSPYIHIGADESGFGGLDQYIVDMDKYIRSLGKKTLLWESFSGKGDGKAIIPEDVIVFAFETLYERPDSLISNGYDVVNASWKPLYITPGWRWTPKDIYNGWDVDTWKNHWEITPSYNTIKVPATDKIKGAELCSWVMPDYMEVPEILARAPAFAEKTWNAQTDSSGGRWPFDRFSRISQALNVLLRKLIFPAKLSITGISEPVYPGLENTGNIFAGNVTIDCASYSRKGFVTYSRNGAFPTADSSRLTGPLHIHHACDVQLAAYDSSGHLAGYYHNYFVRQPLSFSIAGSYTYPRDIDIEDRAIIIQNPVRIFIRSAGAGKGSVSYKLSGMTAFGPYTGKGILIKDDAVVYARFMDDDGNTIGKEISISVRKDSTRAIGHISLDALDISKIYQGIDRPRDVGERAEISIRGTRFMQGVHTRTESRLYVALDGKVRSFASTVGVDDRSEKAWGGDTVQFYVIGDGAILWQSGTMSRADTARRCNVRIDGVKRLLLKVTGRKTAGHIHVDWADASFAYSGIPPRTTWSPEDEAMERLAPQPPKPRINGAMAVGIRPQTPFYYPVAVTGKRPFVITVDGLPGGLYFDRKTGIIQGVPENRGDYKVRLQVSNSAGTARRTLRILVGDTLALTPPMGFLSWNVIQGLISATVLKEMGDAFVRYGLRDVGYQYIMMDDCWAGGRDAEGNIFPDPTRFPDGMKPVGDYLHERGFKLGIYSSPAAVTCGGYPGTLGHESQDAHTWTSWGMDYLKYDLCSAPRDRALDLYRQMGLLLERSGRSVVYALGAGGEEGRGWGTPAHAQVWRTGVDIRDQWKMKAQGGIIDCFDAQPAFADYQHPGGWNDPDMLLAGIYGKGASANDLGASGCNDTEYRSQMSLWCLLSAPLFISADVRNIRPSALAILTNPEVIDVDQDLLGNALRRYGVPGDLEIWVKELADGSQAIGLLNRRDTAARIKVDWADIGVAGQGKVRDLWLRKDMGVFAAGYSTVVPAHGTALFKLSAFKNTHR